MLGALVFLLASGQASRFSGGVIWLLPWQVASDQLSHLPGPLAGYPPAGPHLAELAGIAAAAGVTALAVTVTGLRARGGLAVAGILTVAVICLAGALQLRPIRTADLNRLVGEAASPGSVERCATAHRVRYCLYPGFGRQLPALEAPVRAVLAALPARPGTPLTVRQVVPVYLPDSALTHGHPKGQVSRWEAQLRRAPGNVATASAIYLPVGSWPAAGRGLTDARFDLALATAMWAVRLPARSGALTSRLFLPCVPVDQAREAIAIWLAILATHPPAGQLQDGLGDPGSVTGIRAAEVRNSFVRIWAYPGSDAGYLAPQGVMPQTTATGYLLAEEMARLPDHKVSQLVSSAWATWTDWRTTDAQLAAALSIRMPSVPAMPPPGPGLQSAGPSGPQNPLCTK